jgi:hypothetical protein
MADFIILFAIAHKPAISDPGKLKLKDELSRQCSLPRTKRALKILSATAMPIGYSW